MRRASLADSRKDRSVSRFEPVFSQCGRCGDTVLVESVPGKPGRTRAWVPDSETIHWCGEDVGRRQIVDERWWEAGLTPEESVEEIGEPVAAPPVVEQRSGWGGVAL